ncbi:hypothetical protein [Singulisphaera sp. PoT]|uniref:hypothetical protein n=1 Tax=Singulisphaera sp. PoT TaxID=3411797 RepID=UPI003BF5C6F0
MPAPSQPNIVGGSGSPGAAANLYRRNLGSPALGTTSAVHAAIADNGSQQVVTAAITGPDVPRNVTATSGGTAANITAVQVVVNGTDYRGNAISETLPAFTAGSATTVVGSKAFATVTSIAVPANGTGVTTAIGTGAKLGLPARLNSDTVLNAFLNGVREATRPTVAFDATNVGGNTVTLNSALNGSPVAVDYYHPF